MISAEKFEGFIWSLFALHHFFRCCISWFQSDSSWDGNELCKVKHMSSAKRRGFFVVALESTKYLQSCLQHMVDYFGFKIIEKNLGGPGGQLCSLHHIKLIKWLADLLHISVLLVQSCKSGRAFWVGFGLNFDENFGLTSGPIRYVQINFQKAKLFCYLIFTLCRLT